MRLILNLGKSTLKWPVYRHKAADFPSAPEALKRRSTRANAPDPTGRGTTNSKLLAGVQNENFQKGISGSHPRRAYQLANAAIETVVHKQAEGQ